MRKRKSADGGSSAGLDGEITLLRTLIHRAAAHAEEDRELAEVLKILDSVGRSCAHLAGLIKTNRALGSDQSAEAVLNQALDEVIAELEARNGRPF